MKGKDEMRNNSEFQMKYGMLEKYAGIGACAFDGCESLTSITIPKFESVCLEKWQVWLGGNE